VGAGDLSGGATWGTSHPEDHRTIIPRSTANDPLVGFHNRFLVTMRWLWTYLTFQRGARLIAEDVTRDVSKDTSRKTGAAAKEPGASRGFDAPRVHG
jgi:hypothetical protein